jgi:hypothetical protein
VLDKSVARVCEGMTGGGSTPITEPLSDKRIFKIRKVVEGYAERAAPLSRGK